MHEPIDVDTNVAGTVAAIAIPTDGNGTDATSNAALDALREDIVPADDRSGACGRGRRRRQDRRPATSATR